VRGTCRSKRERDGGMRAKSGKSTKASEPDKVDDYTKKTEASFEGGRQKSAEDSFERGRGHRRENKMERADVVLRG